MRKKYLHYWKSWAKGTLDIDTCMRLLLLLVTGLFRSYGAVFKAMHKRSGNIVACKLVPIDNDLDDLLKEINVMRDCYSPYIVRFYGSFYNSEVLSVRSPN
jgi:serine/threonine protein kinase